MLILGFLCGLNLLMVYFSRNSAITLNIDAARINTTFPALSICPEEILDPVEVEMFLNNQKYLRNAVERKQYKEFLRKLANVNGRTANYFNLIFTDIAPDNYMEIIFKLSKVYSVTIMDQPAVKIMTEVGICYTFNSFLYKELYTTNWLDPKPYPDNLSKRFVTGGFKFEFIHEYPMKSEIVHNITGNMLAYIHSPYEIPTTWSKTAAYFNGTETIKLLLATKEIKYEGNFLNDTTIEARRCRASTESNLAMFPTVYSRHLCLMQYRAAHIAQKCKCLPHFYQNRHVKSLFNVPVCSTQGLNCFAEFIEQTRKPIKSPGFKWKCYPNCFNQITVTNVTSVSSQTNESRILVYIDFAPTEFYERSVMYSTLDYTVTLFAVMSAFMGFGILTLLDFIYFFTVRIYWYRRGYRGSVNDH